MAGTHQGGVAAANTNRKNHGSNFYHIIGAAGGRNGHTGGFYGNSEAARIAGAKGGRKSSPKCSDDEFITAWQFHDGDIQKVADEFGYKVKSAQTRLYNMRRNSNE